jgi:hypothetical protein
MTVLQVRYTVRQECVPDGTDNPLPGIAAGKEFQHNLKSWVVGEPPTPQPVKVVGSYHLF